MDTKLAFNNSYQCVNGEFAVIWSDFLAAVSLAFVFEGILPFLSPHNARQAFAAMASVDDRSMRLLGFLSMAVGIVLLYLVR